MPDPERKDADQLWTAEQVAGYLQVSEVTVNNWVKRGQIPHVKAGSLNRFRKADIDRWVESRGKNGTEAVA